MHELRSWRLAAPPYLGQKNVELKLVKQGHFPSGLKHHTRPGKRLQFAIENGPVEIVDLPMKNGDFQ